jgi:hypothetical protein
MLVRPKDLAERRPKAQLLETVTLPVDAARNKAREILSECPQGGFTAIVENWRQLADGQIEFTTRRLPTGL